MLNIKHPLGTLIINPKYIISTFINPNTKAVRFSLINGDVAIIENITEEEQKEWEEKLMDLNNEAKNE
jgi:hypothetical protein